MRKGFIEIENGINAGSIAKSVYVRKRLSLDGSVKRATAFMSALGIYRPFIDGNLIDSQPFLPGRTAYDKRVQYQEFDLTSYLQKGSEHIIGAEIANGWYRKGTLPKNRRSKKPLVFFCRIVIEYTSGKTAEIYADESFKVSIFKCDSVEYGKDGKISKMVFIRQREVDVTK